MSEEEKKNEVNFEDYAMFYEYDNHEKLSYDYQINDKLDVVVRIVEKREQNMLDQLKKSFGQYDVLRV